MGGPELCQDPGEEHLSIPIGHQQHIVQSDDSDSEAIDASDGYQPLATDDGVEHQYNSSRFVPGTQINDNNGILEEEVIHGDPNMNQIERVDVEIERQVWSEPRPRELQIELDDVRTEQILSAMAGFTLPNVAVPEWAAGIPEEHWKQELLQRIRQRRDVTNDVKQVEQKACIK